uniref:Uncharacterized protein n=1 Tax=Ananas comosus var. bracteatus TaxID=296719 RepID=A0A6V7Q370_ANACO|nr:unnamed protein product [Ananas comosus var. bracteatus]
MCTRGHWRPSEDEKLKELVACYGPHNWNAIAEKLQGRSDVVFLFLAEMVQSTRPEDQPKSLHGGRGRAASRFAPNLWKSVGHHCQALSRADGQRGEEPLACDHGTAMSREVEAILKESLSGIIEGEKLKQGFEGRFEWKDRVPSIEKYRDFQNGKELYSKIHDFFPSSSEVNNDSSDTKYHSSVEEQEENEDNSGGGVAPFIDFLKVGNSPNLAENI